MMIGQNWYVNYRVTYSVRVKQARQKLIDWRNTDGLVCTQARFFPVLWIRVRFTRSELMFDRLAQSW